MNIKKLTGISILIVALVMGCSGNYGKISKQNGTEKKLP
jgi:hypothetical protein